MSGKPGNVREFETCQGKVRDNVNSQGIVREESGKNYCQGKLSQNCSLLVEYLHSIWYLVASMAPYLYDDLMEVVKSLMRRCVKPEVVEKGATAAQLMKIDLDDSKNLLSRHKVVLGVSAQALMAKAKAADLQIMSYQTSCQKFLVATIKKLIERCPLPESVYNLAQQVYQ